MIMSWLPRISLPSIDGFRRLLAHLQPPSMSAFGLLSGNKRTSGVPSPCALIMITRLSPPVPVRPADGQELRTFARASGRPEAIGDFLDAH